MKSYGWGATPNMNGFKSIGIPTAHGRDIYNVACQIFERLAIGEQEIRLVSVGVSSLTSESAMVFEMFTQPATKSLDKAIDNINGVYGQFTVRTADILHQRAKETELQVERENMTFHPESVV